MQIQGKKIEDNALPPPHTPLPYKSAISVTLLYIIRQWGFKYPYANPKQTNKLYQLCDIEKGHMFYPNTCLFTLVSKAAKFSE